jgi:hypothetical protein
MEQDVNGHWFVEVSNLRLTFVPKEDRSDAKDWSGSDVIRIQARRNSKDNALHMGAEYPVSGEGDITKLMLGIRGIYAKGQSAR